MSTREAYGWLDADASVVAPRAKALRPDVFASWAGVSKLAHNDFETVVAPRFAEIGDALVTLRERARESDDAAAFALLAGSGATVFLVSNAPPSTIAFPHGSTSRIIRTRTASRVVAVEVSG